MTLDEILRGNWWTTETTIKEDSGVSHIVSMDKDNIKAEIIKLIRELVPLNPYPEDIWIEPTKEQYNLFHQILQKQGLTLDKFTGALGRRIWDAFRKDMLDKIADIKPMKGGINDQNIERGKGELI